MKINEIIVGKPCFGIPRQVLQLVTSSPHQGPRSHRTLKQIVLVMNSAFIRINETDKRKWMMRAKLTTLIMLLFLLQVSAASRAQITLKERKAPLQKVLKTISKQSGYDLIYSVNDLKDTKPVNVEFTNVSLEKALELCFSGQPLVYEVADKTVMIKRKEGKGMMEKIIDYFQSIEVKGKIVDENGKALAGASVVVKGTKQTAISGSDGTFTLKNLADDAIIVISFIGYQTRELKVAMNLGDIKLEMVNGQLDQVQIQAYGVTTKRLATGNIATVSAATIGQQPVTNVIQALNGRIAGVQVTQNSSIPGSPLTVQIRGVNSLGTSSSSNRPLYIIDDVPFPTEPIASFGFLTGIEPTNIINPGDIESITILKDADATAIYGSRGANGVVLITTKKGKAGKTKLEATYNRAFSNVSHVPELMSTEQYLQVRRDAFANSGITPTTTNAPDLLTWDQNLDNNILEWYIGNTAQVNDATTTFSGGNENTQFLLSGNFRKETNVFSGDNNYRRGNVHFSINHSSNDHKLKIAFSGLFSTDYNRINTNSGITNASQTVPNYPLLDINGKYNWLANQQNILAANTAYSKLSTTNLNLSLNGTYAISPKLLFTANLGLRNLFNDVIAVNPSTAKDPAQGTFAQGNSAFYNTTTSTLLAEPQLNYSENLFGGKMQFLVGSTIQRSGSRNEQLTLINYLSDLLMESRNGGTLNSANSVRSQYNFLSAFARLNYNWKDRYILNGTFRRDGSSRFGPNNRFGNFGSIGAAWLFSNEEFLKNKLNWLSYGKVRASFGTTGSDGIGDFGYLSLYTTTTDYGTQKAILPSQIANPDYQWELTKKLEAAIDLGFLKDRILLSAAWYRNRSGNQLVLFPLPATTGFSGYTANLPALVQNTGLEFDLSTSNIEQTSFSWKTNFTLTIPKNKLLEFPNIEQTSFANTLVIGKPVRSYLAYQLQGIDPNTGIASVVDVSGNGTISANSSYNNRGGDKIWVGTSDPKLYAGMNNSFRYKGLQLDFFLQYTEQVGYNLFSSTSFASFGTMLNGFTAYLDYWKTPGQEAQVPKPFASLNSGVSRFASSDRAFSNASFLRLKTVSVSYQLPQRWSNAIKVYNLQLVAQGQNLWTITDYNGSDPEIAPSGAVTIAGLRTISFGLKAGF